MPPKRKVQNLLAGAKSAQKKSKKSTNSSASETYDTGRNETICYESFSTTIDPAVNEIVALANALGLTCAPDLHDDDEYCYGDEITAWDKQHYEVRVQKY